MQSESGAVFANAIDIIPPLAALTSVPLDPPTVIDDPGYFDAMESIGHLPAALKGAHGLRGLYSWHSTVRACLHFSPSSFLSPRLVSDIRLEERIE